MVWTQCTPKHVWPLTCHLPHHNQQLCSTFFKKKLFYRTQHIMPFRNNSVKQNRLEDQNWKKRWRKCHMFKCCYEPQASIKPVNDCHQMTFLTTRSTARILIRNLHHRHALPLTRPAVSSRGGYTRHERATEIEPTLTQSLVWCY